MPYTRLDIVKPGRRQYRRRPPAVRAISQSLYKQLESDLKLERDVIMTERPNMRILGAQYLCSDAVIKTICDRADTITCVDDLSSIPLLRTELRSRFCDIVIKTVGSAPSAKKRRRK